MKMDTFAVVDFETTGLMPAAGGRATAVAAVLVRGGEIVGHFQSLMHTGVPVPPFIEQLTGISNEMLRDAPPAAKVMREVAAFTAGCGMVAHNAPFDRAFWRAELGLAGVPLEGDDTPFACTVLLSRRVHPEAPSHKLGSLARWHTLPDSGRAHRALADAQTTAHLLLRLLSDLSSRHAAVPAPEAVPHRLLLALQRAPRDRLAHCIEAHARACPAREDATEAAGGG